MEKKRNITYDYLRGFAMLFIVFGHLYFYSKRSEGSLAFNVCATIELPVFMYISGLLAHVSVDRYGFRKLIWAKVIRLLFPFLSFYIIWGLLDSYYWLQFLLKEHKHGYWFVLVLFELMVTLSFVKKCSIQFKIKTVYVNIVVYAIASLVFSMIPKGGLIDHLFCVKLYWHFYPFFMMGYYSYRLERFLQLKYAPVYLSLYLFVLFYFEDILWKVSINMVCNLFSLLFLVSLFSTSFKPLKNVFATVGVNSLQVYLLHFFLLFPLVKVLPVVENRWLEFPYYVLIASVLIFVTIEISKLLMKNSWLAMFLFGVRRKK